MKRAFDVVLSIIGLVLTAPLWLVIAVIIKLDSRGPCLFKQERVGRAFVPFKIYKFRTMTVRQPADGPLITADSDARITRVGRWLRRSKLDELPQLMNVLKGEMSFVGARPEVPRYVNLFRDEYTEILRLRPGITDAASIFYREEGRLLQQAKDPEADYVERILPEKLRLSRGYGEQASLGFDLRLVLSTLAALLYPSRLLERVIEAAGRFHLVLAVLTQAALFALANWAAVMVRFDYSVPAHEWALFVRVLPLFVCVHMLWLQPFNLYHGLWRYAGLREIRNTAFACTAGSLTLWAVIHWFLVGMPYSRGVIAMDWLLSISLLSSIRLVRRLHREIQTGGLPTHKVVIVGQEDSMERLLREIVDGSAYPCRVVGLVNGSSGRRGMRIHGIPILGGRTELDRILSETRPDEVLVVLPAEAAEERAALLKDCRRHCRCVRIVPDVTDVLSGKEGRTEQAGIDAEDLLFREPIQGCSESVFRSLKGRRVMITGAGGSIGSEICRQVAACEPASVILFERHEHSLYQIDRELRGSFPALRLDPVIGDVADAERVGEVMSRLRPELVFHAAAYKHVPMMEHNPLEALRTNAAGTATVGQAAVRCGTDAFVLISTDKAVEPLSIMGTTKRIAELALQDLHGSGSTRFLTVRFGNVLESSGSVVPLFREQIEKGGPVTVTHPEVARLFMTVPEAVQLILLAETVGKGGEVFVLQMGRPIRILDMARALIRRYAPAQGKQIEIVFTGLRPGERLFEKLFNDYETVWKTPEPKLLMAISIWDAAMRHDERERLIRTVEERLGRPACAVRRVLEGLAKEELREAAG